MIENYQSNSQLWFDIKNQIHNSGKDVKFHEREIWWCSIGLNVGYEIYGKGATFNRPVLVYKKINNKTFVGLPMSKNIKSGYSGRYTYNNTSILF